MDKTKLEYLKDLATVIQGLKVNTEAAYKLAVENLGQDYGLYQVIALLSLALRDIIGQSLMTEITQEAEAIDDNPNQSA